MTMFSSSKNPDHTNMEQGIDLEGEALLLFKGTG
jgi:hypothetical protein